MLDKNNYVLPSIDAPIYSRLELSIVEDFMEQLAEQVDSAAFEKEEPNKC